MKLIFSFFFLLVSHFGFSQSLTVIGALSEEINETSGVVFVNDHLITHNDSGQEPYLYTIDKETGDVLRTTVVENATNVDWEDICHDDEYIYIGDFGNNLGDRTDLKVYKISIDDFENNSVVSAEIIEYNYSEQEVFEPSQFTTNFYAEALISKGENLYVFTKNWGNNMTNVYQIPKNPGNYSVEKVESINVQGYITGASFNESSNRLVLSGYTLFSTFISVIRNSTESSFSDGDLDKYNIVIPEGYSKQIESVTFKNEMEIYLTAEKQHTNLAVLYSMNLEGQLTLNLNQGLEENDFLIYPNPTNDFIIIENEEIAFVEMYSMHGKLVASSGKSKMDVSSLPVGIYNMKIYDHQKRLFIKQFQILKN